MKIGQIYIYGAIGDSLDGSKAVSLLDVIQAVRNQPDADIFHVHINSPGGLVQVGDDIYDYLIGIGKPITTIVEGLCASIATKIALAGSIREMQRGSEFFIHLPWAEPQGTAEELRIIADSLEKTEDNLIKFYHEKTGLEKEALFSLLRAQTALTDEQALNLGFVTKIVDNVKAFAILKPKSKQEKENDMKDSKKTLAVFAGLKNWFKAMSEGIEIKAMAITLQDGSTVWMDGEMAVGTMVLDAEGGNPVGDATHVMSDGKSIVTEGGVIVEIIEAAAAQPNPELAALTKERDELKAELESAKKAQSDYQASVDAEILAIKKLTTSNFQPKAAAKTYGKQEPKADDVDYSEERKKRKEQYKSTKK